MELLKLTQCKRSWPLVSEAFWPSALVGLSLHGHLMIEGETDLVLDCQLLPRSQELSRTLCQCLPQLGLASLAEVSRESTFTDLVDLKSWLNAYGIPYSEASIQILTGLAEAPEAFRLWVNAKKLSYKEYSVTELVTQQEHRQMLLSRIAKLSLSRQEGARVLELASELLGMEKPAEIVFDGSSSPRWVKQLEALRYPNSSASDQSQKQRLGRVQLPKDINASWLRRGDVSGLQVGLFIRSEEDFEKKLDRLRQIQKDLASHVFERVP